MSRKTVSNDNVYNHAFMVLNNQIDTDYTPSMLLVYSFIVMLLENITIVSVSGDHSASDSFKFGPERQCLGPGIISIQNLYPSKVV